MVQCVIQRQHARPDQTRPELRVDQPSKERIAPRSPEHTLSVLCTMDYATYPDKPRPRTHFPTMQRTDMKCYTIFHQTIVMLHKYIVQVLGQGWRRSLLIFYASMFVFFSILALTIMFLYLLLYHMCLPGALQRVVQGLEPGRVLYLYLYLYFTSY